MAELVFDAGITRETRAGTDAEALVVGNKAACG